METGAAYSKEVRPLFTRIVYESTDFFSL